jgi:hypothetical protein
MYCHVHHYSTFHIHSSFSFPDASSPQQQWQRNDNYHDLITSKLLTVSMKHHRNPEKWSSQVSWHSFLTKYKYIHLMNASVGIFPCLFSSVKTYVACWISQPVSSRHLQNLINKVNMEQDSQYMYKRNIVACLCNHCCHGMASNTYSVCVCSLRYPVIQHAKHMYHIILSPASWLAIPYCSTLLHHWHDFGRRGVGVI